MQCVCEQRESRVLEGTKLKIMHSISGKNCRHYGKKVALSCHKFLLHLKMQVALFQFQGSQMAQQGL